MTRLARAKARILSRLDEYDVVVLMVCMASLLVALICIMRWLFGEPVAP